MARILILDKSVGDRVQIMNALKPHGHGIIEIDDGKEALNAVEEHPPDLIVMDLVLVSLDGFKVLRTLRERGHKMPIIVQSTMAPEGMEKQAKEVGASAFLRKPVNENRLLETVTELLASK
ncbi:MAG: response regulator [Candidatus Hydrogenedentota bacterium]